MFWADKVVERAKEQFAKEIAEGRPLIIRDEKTASGRVHVGSMRGVAVHGVVSEALTEAGIANTFLYEINDVDPMDDIPGYLDASVYKKYLGRPLKDIPSPEEGFKNFAELYGREFEQVIIESGFNPQFYRAHTLYDDGKMDEVIRIALERAPLIREIYKGVSGSTKEGNWLPLSIIVHDCPDGEVPFARSYDGKEVSYVCVPFGSAAPEKGATEGNVSPFKGNAKLPWKVEWAAKFKVLGVHIEGAGKDHSTKGGARDVADTISREVFEHEPPLDIPYEFFLVGGKKMSSSKGRGSSSREIADLLPAALFRLALLSKDPKQAFNFDPEGDTIPVLYDLYDRLAEKYWEGVSDDQARLFVLSHKPEERTQLTRRFLPRFSLVAFLVQMTHLNLEEEVEKMKGSPLTEDDREELRSRAAYAKKWLTMYAPEAFRFELRRNEVPEAARQFSHAQKEALKKLLPFIESKESLDGQELHTTLHNIRTESNIEPEEFFSAIYVSFLGKNHGPKAGWFLSVIERPFLISRLKEVTAS